MKSNAAPAAEGLPVSFNPVVRIEWPGEDGVEYHPTHSQWIHLLRDNGIQLRIVSGDNRYVAEHVAKRFGERRIVPSSSTASLTTSHA